MSESKTIGIIGALDTKGLEFAFLKAEIEKRGFHTLVVNVGVLGEPRFRPDIGADEVAQAGGQPLADLVARHDRGEAMTVMTRGAVVVARTLYEEGRIDGIVSMGGGAGTAIATSAMRVLPVGFPKLMVSTLASGETSQYVDTTDITMMPSVVDVAGVNRISRVIFTNAAGAICGMVDGGVAASVTAASEAAASPQEKPLIAASMFGNTTRAVDGTRRIMEENGYEVLVFHATGIGGKTMERLIANGFISGVLDITTTEWADEICGGVLSAGPSRLEAAGKAGIPQVVVPGCIDMCNFWKPDTVPPRYRDRLFYQWNPNVTLMRTTPDENERMGEVFAERLNAARGPAAVVVPTRGFSELDAPGKPFWWPEADSAFVSALKSNLRPGIPVVLLENNINDPEFSSRVSHMLLEMLAAEHGRKP